MLRLILNGRMSAIWRREIAKRYGVKGRISVLIDGLPHVSNARYTSKWIPTKPLLNAWRLLAVITAGSNLAPRGKPLGKVGNQILHHATCIVLE